MIAENLISDTIIPLRTSDTGAEALGIMNEFYLRHLPIVNQEELLGLLSEDEILDNDAEEPVGSYHLTLNHPFVQTRDHLYDVMRLVADHQLTAIPVVDDQRRYVGLITTEHLIRHFAESGAFREPGGIIVLEMTRQDYSLAQIARIVESENAVILSAHVQTFPDSPRIEVTIKVNKQNIGNILASFERFDFIVKATFNELEYFDTLRERYDGLINYLNV
ncbi:MAG: CBS domain-containing protein [Bacteroidetes bacterium]|nr:MAG: CBS domain-containing protein [Bacteroidota bacterium]PTM10233.1 MAG: CBS domain-containing protein [Bacteroidota bacterium]